MHNVQQVIDRYKDKIDNRNNVIGYLAFGGRGYYKINSSKELRINSDGTTEFFTNEEGQVEHYEILDIEPKVIGFERWLDGIHTEPVTQKEIDLNNWELYEDYFNVYNDEDRVKKWYGDTIEKYYFHPYYPNRKVISFEVIRILPGHLVGSRISIGKEEFAKSNEELIKSDKLLTSERVSYYYAYPEFFKPIYSDKKR